MFHHDKTDSKHCIKWMFSITSTNASIEKYQRRTYVNKYILYKFESSTFNVHFQKRKCVACVMRLHHGKIESK